ncbi:type II secretion system protein GspM [Limnohabitans sp.]|uniref:type II secretion system protein GspM n=1 Tax=Limnohabitans sp. TaxID=1907725 RepID=UPI003340EDC0
MKRWQALSPREQRGVSVLGALIGVVLFWSIAIAPALNTLRDSDNRRAHIGQQQAHMLSLQNQAQALQTRTPLSRDEALRNLQSLSAGIPIQLNVQGDRVSVQLKAVPAPILANWLSQARSQAQALPVEVQLTRSNAAAASNVSASTLATANSVVVWDGSLFLSLPNRGAAAR